MSKNKIEQAKRRSFRKEVQGYVKAQYTILGEVVKPRPKFIPLRIWAFGARIFINTNKLRDFMENGISGERNKSTD